VLAHGSDAQPAEEAIAVAAELGLTARMCSPGQANDPRQVLLLFVSAAAMTDAEFVQTAARAASAPHPTVPILLDPIPPDALPPGVSKHNWLDLSAADQADARQEIRRILATDPASFLYFQDMAARADRWQRTGGMTDTLLSSVKQAKEAARRLQNLKGDLLIRHPTNLARYVQTSLKHARKARRKRVWQLASRTAIVAVVIAAIGLTRAYTRHLNQQSLATLQVAGTDLRLNTDTNFFAFRAIQNAMALGGNQPNLHVVKGLQQQWLAAVLTTDNHHFLGPGQFNTNGSYWSEHAGGQVIRWDPSTGTAEATWQVSDGRLTFSVTPDESKLMAVTADGAFIFDLATGAKTPIDAPITQSALVAAGNNVAAATLDLDGSTLIATFDLNSGRQLSAPKAYDTVLDLKNTTKGLVALVRQGTEVLLVDVAADAGIAQHRLPTAPTFDIGAVAPDGEAFVLVVNGAVYLGNSEALSSAGFTTRDLPDALALTSSGLVVLATAQDGVRVYESKLHVELGRVCRSLVSTMSLSVTADNTTVACNNGFNTEIWDLASLTPAAVQPPGATVSTTAAVTGGGINVSVTAQGVLALDQAGASGQLEISSVAPMLTGQVTVVAMTNDGNGVLVGTDEGWVVAFDLIGLDHDVLYRVQQWRVPTGSSIEAAGWTADQAFLAVKADGLWWTPIACFGCTDPVSAVAMAIERQPPCWYESNLAVFTAEFIADLGMSQCSPIPEPRG